MKTINIDGQEAITVEEACMSLLKDINESLLENMRRVNDVLTIISKIQELKEETNNE